MQLVRSTFFIALASFLSRLLGVMRENLLASQFGGLGGSNPLDAYYAAFRIPDFLFNLVIMSVGAAVFVPIFARFLKKDPDQVHRILNNFLSVAFVFLAIGSVLLYLALPLYLDGLTLGLPASQKELTGNLIRIMLLSPLFFGISSILSSYLSVYKNFTGYIWSPLLYNISIILGIVFLVPLWGVYGVAWGVVIGALCHAAVQLFPLMASKHRYVWTFSLKDRSIREMSRLIVPRIVGVSASQISLLVDTVIAGTLAAGSLTIFNWSQNIQYVPIGLVGISISITAFTVLSDHAAEDNRSGVYQALMNNMRVIIFIMLPMTFGFFLLRYSLVDLVFNYGKFSSVAENLNLTANVLGVFAGSLIFQALVPLLTRVFYAYQDTRTPVLITIITVLINTVLSLFFVWTLHLGLVGLALSFSIAQVVNTVLLLYFMNNKFIQKQAGDSLLSFLGNCILATCIMGSGCWGVHTLLSSVGEGKVFIILDLLGTSFIGMILFFAFTKWLGIREADLFIHKFFHRKKTLE